MTPPLRVGMMMRGVDEIDGMGVLLRSLCGELFRRDRVNEYVLFYRSREQTGRYGSFPNVAERVVSAPSKLVWDQLLVPLAAWRERVDVLFHHKFTVPLVPPCPTVVQQAGAEYWTHPRWYDRLDGVYARTMIPVYCSRATTVLTPSESLARQLRELAGLDPDKTVVLFMAPDPKFRRVEDRGGLEGVGKRYGLPEKPFFLMVAKGYASVGSAREAIYPRKNVEGTVEAYRRLQDRRRRCPPLVVAGPGFHEEAIEAYRRRLPRPDALHFPGYVEHDDMPALYNLALALVFPSYSESFGIPLVEAMACGTPVIAANTASCPEIVGEAGLLVDPSEPGEIAAAMERLLSESGLAPRLRERGLARASRFTWEKSVEEFLSVLGRAARRKGTS